jgi:hypothetical protein
MKRHLLALLSVAACGPAQQDLPYPGGARGKADGADGWVEPARSFRHDIAATELAIDLASHEGRATIRTTPDEDGASFEAQGLEIVEVTTPAGEAIPHRLQEGRLDLGLPAGSAAEVVVRYRFVERDALEGLARGGHSFTWPYFCGNLFPCKSDPADGLRFKLALAGGRDGEKIVYPTEIAAEAPSYMLAWSAGEYSYEGLGQTASGTEVGVYYLPGGREDALRGVADLRAAFGWLEDTIGPYSFGKRVASVSVKWGPSGYGGMEHHPFFHVADVSMDDAYIQAHEAAHGWFGDGIRLRCWEDFVLSEGPTSYLAARALVGVATAERRREVERALWNRFRARLEGAVASSDHLAWPAGCGKVDIIKDGLFTSIPYMKGAFFLRAVERLIGSALVDAALAGFYRANVGRAAGMGDLVAALRKSAQGGGRSADEVAAIDELAQSWLRGKGLPAGYRELAAWSSL